MDYSRKIDLVDKEKLKKALATDEGIKKIVKTYFYDDKGNPLELTSYQTKIVKRILHKKPKRVLLWATRRGGKSYALSVGIILVAVLRTGESVKIIGPTQDDANIIMENVREFITHDEDILKTVSNRKGKKEAEKVKDELSKTRITFENQSDVSTLSANISSNTSNALGRGGTLIIVDEAEKIPADIIRNEILPMIGEHPNAQIILCSNPTMPNNRGFMYEKKKEQENQWEEIVIPWQKVVLEGRLTVDFVREMKRNLTEAEFIRWYEARYPEEIEGGLLKAEWVDKALERVYKPDNFKTAYGLDVAGEGKDLTVLTKVKTWNEKGKDKVKVDEVHDWNISDTMKATKQVMGIVDQGQALNVDAIGIGKGVGDRLKERGYNVNFVKVSKKPVRSSKKEIKETDTFSNLKAQLYWYLRSLFEYDKIDLLDKKIVKEQLLSMTYDYTNRGRKKIIDPEKSPDFADSLALSMYSHTLKKRPGVTSMSLE